MHKNVSQQWQATAKKSELQNLASRDTKLVKTPLEIQIINFLGLQKFMMDQFVFRRKKPKYSINKIDNVNVIMGDKIYQPPIGYLCIVEVLQKNGHSVPVLKLIPPKCQYTSTIIYAHGNSSDMYDSLAFIQRMSITMSAQFIIFDYSGYGCSKTTDITEHTICRDMEIVLAWATKGCSVSNIVLWGFSLGTYPTLYCATKYPVRGIILQSPLASVSSLLHQQTISPFVKYEKDFLCNLDLIEMVNSQILILHSTQDQIIPFSHSKALLQRYVRMRGDEKIQLLQVSRLGHNQMHKYFCSHSKNPLQIEFIQFIKRIQRVSEMLRCSRFSDSSIRTNKLKLYTQKLNNPKIHHLGKGDRDRQISQYSELENIYGQLYTRNITEVNEEDYEVICEKGKKVKVFKKNTSTNAFGCFCI